MPNHFFITGSSNSDDAAAISNNDRKWAVHELRAPQFTEAEQRWIYHEFLLLPRAAAVLRHYFLNISLEGFTASAKAPDTTARQEMVNASTSSDAELLATAFEQMSEPLKQDVTITGEVMEYIHKHSPARPNAHRVAKLLSRAPVNGKPIQFSVNAAKYRGTILRKGEINIDVDLLFVLAYDDPKQTHSEKIRCLKQPVLLH